MINKKEFAKKHNLPLKTVQNHFKAGKCNLMRKEKRDRSHPLYKTWAKMKERCYNPKDVSYKNYGAKGIRVCGPWFYSFTQFVKDMGDRPKGYTLDRLNNKLNYSKENCRWASRYQQICNRSISNPIPGINYQKYCDKWAIRKSYQGEMKYFGLYNTKSDAIVAYKQLVKQGILEAADT
jgi:hypothetical protein